MTSLSHGELTASLSQVFCKAVCSLMKKLGVKHITEKLCGDRLVGALEHELGRSLKQYELDICHFPRVCAVSGGGGSNQDALKNCSRCHCVAWSPENIEKGKGGWLERPPFAPSPLEFHRPPLRGVKTQN